MRQTAPNVGFTSLGFSSCWDLNLCGRSIGRNDSSPSSVTFVYLFGCIGSLGVACGILLLHVASLVAVHGLSSGGTGAPEQAGSVASRHVGS